MKYVCEIELNNFEMYHAFPYDTKILGIKINRLNRSNLVKLLDIDHFLTHLTLRWPKVTKVVHAIKCSRTATR